MWLALETVVDVNDARNITMAFIVVLAERYNVDLNPVYLPDELAKVIWLLKSIKRW